MISSKMEKNLTYQAILSLQKVLENKFIRLFSLRRNSKTFLSYAFVNLSSQNQKQLWIPKGFAHGFLTLTDNAEVFYKTTNYWNKDSELCLLWDDPDINIDWPLSTLKKEINVSEKDKNGFLVSQLDNNDLFL